MAISVTIDGINIELELDENCLLHIRREGVPKGAINICEEEPAPIIPPNRDVYEPENPELPEGLVAQGDDIVDENGNSIFGIS